MNLETLRMDFIKWVESKTSKPFPIKDKLALALLDQALNETLTNPTGPDNSPGKLRHEELMKLCSVNWLTLVDTITASPLVKTIHFRRSEITDNNSSQNISEQVHELIDKCLTPEK